MEIKYIKKHDKCCTINEKNGVTYITFPKLEKYGDEIVHGFTTRLGGVSKEHLASLNLSFTRGDDPECVMENHRRFAATLGYDEKRLVFSDQVHLTDFYKVTEEDCGKGIIRESDIKQIDGLVTNVPDVPMITFYADCVPLMFYDPVKKVIAMAHSGWKGTVKRIGAKMVAFMENEYGCKPSDIVCVIAPSICQDCYEVSEDVAQEFIREFSDDMKKTVLSEKQNTSEKKYMNEKKSTSENRIISEKKITSDNDDYNEEELLGEMIYHKGNGKYQLNLHKACELVLINAGILRENIDITDICTCCNPELLFSHRASHGRRGNNAAVMMLSK